MLEQHVRLILLRSSNPPQLQLGMIDMQGFAEAGGRIDLIGQSEGDVKASYLPHQNVPDQYSTLVRLQRKNPHTSKPHYKTTAMATIRPMRPDDLLKFSSTNLDHLTETYNIGFYLEYLTKWPELCQVIEGIDGKIEGYSTDPKLLLLL